MMTALPFVLDNTWGMHDGVGVGWGIVMMGSMVLFWGAILLGLAWLIRGGAPRWSAPEERLGTKETSVEILERRFAEGTISLEDYQARRKVLVNGTAEPSEQ